MGSGRYTILCTTLALLTVLVLTSVPEHVMGEKAADTLLFLHGGSPPRLDTIAPQPGEVGPLLNSGGSIRYNLSYPVVSDMAVRGPSGSPGYLHVHLAVTIVSPLSSGLVLKISVHENRAGGTSRQLAALDVQQNDISGGDFLLPLSQGTSTVERGSRLMLDLALEGTGSINYQYYTRTGDFSHVSFSTDAIPDGALDIRMESGDGAEIDEILPNGPEESRRVNFICRAGSVFGAYDIDSMVLSMIGAGGAYIFNETSEQPVPGGGEEHTYFNFTRVIEPIPSGTYTISLLATSNTGQRDYSNTTLKVSPGLYLSLPDTSTRGAEAGETVTFQVDVLNGGNSVDRVTFSGSSPSGWSVIAPDQIDLDPGSTETVDFMVEVPLSGKKDHIEEIALEGRSRNADRTYTTVGEVEVTAEATFGIGIEGSQEVAIYSGMSANYSLVLSNLMNRTGSFRVWLEDLPGSWEWSISAGVGSMAGEGYEVELAAGSSEPLSLVIEVPGSDDGGKRQFTVNCDEADISEPRSVNLALLVVDPGKEPLEVVDGKDEMTSARVGFSHPIMYKQVQFFVSLYNPTLEDQGVTLSADGPSGWDIELDGEEFLIRSGVAEQRALRVTPEDGELYDPNGFRIDLTADLSGTGEEFLVLTVYLEEVRQIGIEADRTLLSGREGDTLKVNFTVENRGNVDEDVLIDIAVPEGISMNLSKDLVPLAPGGAEKVYGTLDINSVTGEAILEIKVRASASGLDPVEATVQLNAIPGEEVAGSDWAIYVAAGVAALVLLAVGFLVYSKRIKLPSVGKGRKEKGEEERPSVSLTPIKERGAVPTPPSGRPAADRDIMEEADHIAEDLLSEDEEVVQMKLKEPGRSEAVQATVLE